MMSLLFAIALGCVFITSQIVAKESELVSYSGFQTVIDNQNTNTNKNTSDTKAAYNLDWTSYHRLSNIYAFLTYLNTTYPRLVQLINIGSSYEKRPLYVIRISSSPSPGTRPAIWIDGGFHAREWISPAVATYIIQQLVEVPANAKLLSNVDWYIMPVVNPDGL
ncbi:hypothetical protein OUZ56_013052 [Daphnia magna]|uniref:Peptidase M14 domain-containing protein n=1 Tax=Daphnia magna TaxID=35525 RepID=A0ABQ9Z4R1_9CRUS|nr:hypothetical protein OUZ56_013052 [Daphnia magna]